VESEWAGPKMAAGTRCEAGERANARDVCEAAHDLGGNFGAVPGSSRDRQPRDGRAQREGAAAAEEPAPPCEPPGLALPERAHPISPARRTGRGGALAAAGAAAWLGAAR